MQFLLYLAVCPVKDGLSTDFRSDSFDDEAFETGRKNVVVLKGFHKSRIYCLP